MGLPYGSLATNNLHKVRKDPKGAWCVYCLTPPNCHVYLQLIDKTTILCPNCGIDAVVPASKVESFQTLQHWHFLAFEQGSEGTKRFKYGPKSTVNAIVQKKSCA